MVLSNGSHEDIPALLGITFKEADKTELPLVYSQPSCSDEQSQVFTVEIYVMPFLSEVPA